MWRYKSELGRKHGTLQQSWHNCCHPQPERQQRPNHQAIEDYPLLDTLRQVE
jgi:hypothetical protein